MDDVACPPPAFPPVSPPPESEFVTPGLTHWHDFLGTIDLIEVERLGQAPAGHRYGPSGAYSIGVQVVNAIVGTSHPGIDVHWWFDLGSAVRYRVHYYCTADRCDIR